MIVGSREHVIDESKSKVGAEFDEYMLMHSPFPYSPNLPVDHTHVLWTDRRLLLLPESGQPWVRGRVVHMEQGNCGPFMGFTRWYINVAMNETEKSFLLHRTDLTHGGTLMEPGSDELISFKWLDPPTPTRSAYYADQFPKADSRARLVGLLSAPERNGTVGLLEHFVTERGRWAFVPDDGSAKVSAKPECLEPVDPAFPYAATGIGEDQPWTVPEWNAEDLASIDLATLRAAADKEWPDDMLMAYPPTGEQRDAKLSNFIQILLALTHQRAQGDTWELIMARRKSQVEITLLKTPARVLLNSRIMHYLIKNGSAALCVALMATLPKRVLCLEAFVSQCGQADAGQHLGKDHPPEFFATSEDFARTTIGHYLCDLANRLGELYEEGRLHDERWGKDIAILFYRRCHMFAVRWWPEHITMSLCNLGLALKRAGQLKEALEMYDKVAAMEGGESIKNNRDILLEELENWKGTLPVTPWDSAEPMTVE